MCLYLIVEDSQSNNNFNFLKIKFSFIFKTLWLTVLAVIEIDTTERYRFQNNCFFPKGRNLIQLSSSEPKNKLT